ncbi:hypothetical protein [Sabulicella rubraurantiaca]|uniref:hypothetical protein n=1 Tax=Sabulicella rubraurantiaca TaxID=2811429 RepID=UPI001A961598|nr:hypothetical protein [Sabulicella rubraurantiaca]
MVERFCAAAAMLAGATLLTVSTPSAAAPTAPNATVPYYQVVMNGYYDVVDDVDPSIRQTRQIQLVYDITREAYHSGYEFKLLIQGASGPGEVYNGCPHYGLFWCHEKVDGLMDLRIYTEPSGGWFGSVNPPQAGYIAPVLAFDLESFRTTYPLENFGGFHIKADKNSRPEGWVHYHEPTTDVYARFDFSTNGMMSGYRSAVFPGQGESDVSFTCGPNFGNCDFVGTVSRARVVAPVPAPGGVALLVLGAAMLAGIRLRRQG